MGTHNLALIGFGGVNRSLAELIHERSSQLVLDPGIELRIVAITDLIRGSWVDAHGIDLEAALAVPSGETFASFQGGSADPDNEHVIKNSNADIVVEATFTNPQDGEPANSHVRWALESGKHVATTNKGPVALYGREHLAMAGRAGVRFEFEGAVLSGTPILRFAETQLRGQGVTGFEGILNGTCNYVLERMADGLRLEEAIAEAQQLGYAEADPTADISGADVRLKVTILANRVLGAQIAPEQVDMTGIGQITSADVAAAARDGQVWKLIGSASTTADGTVSACVRPMLLPQGHVLAGISGSTNAVSFNTDLLGDITVSGPGAGRVETAYALLTDIIAIDDVMSKKEPGRV